MFEYCQVPVYLSCSLHNKQVNEYKQLYSGLKGEGRERKKEEIEVSLGADWTVMEKFKHITFQQKQKCVLCDQIE